MLVSSSVGSEGQDSHTSKKKATAAPPLTSESMCIVVYSIFKSLTITHDSYILDEVSIFSLTAVSGDCPTLPELLKLKVPQWVADKYKTFGIFLLNDETGVKTAIIKAKCHSDPEEITMEILSDWLQGKGTGVSWESLIETLRNCGLSYRADQIQMSLDQHKSS